MSGGSMDYLYRKVEDAHFAANTPERVAFRRHLEVVAEALREIEWVDSGDSAPGVEADAIRACVGHTAVLEAAIEMASRAKSDLEAALARCRKAIAAGETDR